MFRRAFGWVLILAVLTLAVAVSAGEIPATDVSVPFFQDRAPFEIDGSIADWSPVPVVYMDQAVQMVIGEWKGDRALSARIKTAFDPDALYLLAEVNDATPMVNNQTGTNIYNGDCLELYLGFAGPHTSYAEGDYQVGFSACARPESWNWTKARGLEGVTLAVVPSAGGYVMEGRVPLSNFGSPAIGAGTTLSFDMALDNGEMGRSRSGQLVWHGDGTGWQTPRVWGMVALVPPEGLESLLQLTLAPRGVKGKLTRAYVLLGGQPVEGAEVCAGTQKATTDGRGTAELTLPGPGEVAVSASLAGKTASVVVHVTEVRTVELFRFPVRAVKIDQAGYRPRDSKVAVVTGQKGREPAGKFYVLTALSEKVAWEGTLSSPKEDFVTDECLCQADFSAFTRPGSYKIRVPGVGDSYVFEVGDDVYGEVYRIAARSYFLQRCGTAIDDKESGIKHAACHLDDARLKGVSGMKLDLTGGWHDAGDYGKYMPTAAVTAAQLMLAYELFPDLFADGDLGILESGNGTADLLDEVRYELEWMLRMQQEDGGVLHKINSPNFPGMIRPEEDTGRRLAYEVGTADTGTFAGAMAIAARVYRAIDAPFAGRCLQAAQKAAGFLATHRATLKPTNDNTGAYATGGVSDETLWAFAELFRTTGQMEHFQTAEPLIPRYKDFGQMGWDNTITFAYLALLAAPGTPAEVRSEIADSLRSQADRVAEKVAYSGYHMALGLGDFAWASNKAALANAVNLIIADKFWPNPAYRAAALSQLHYVLGVNALSKSFVTLIGTDYPRYPHHRLVKANGTLVPGLLVGGPNDNAEDGRYPKGLRFKGYVDEEEAYSCNEYAIDYNAPLVFVAAYFAGAGE